MPADAVTVTGVARGEKLPLPVQPTFPPARLPTAQLHDSVLAASGANATGQAICSANGVPWGFTHKPPVQNRFDAQSASTEHVSRQPPSTHTTRVTS